jgi:opacity protein-like surface antigen
MKKLAGLCGFLAVSMALSTVPAIAQDQPPPATEQTTPPLAPAPTKPVKAKRVYITPRYELSGGYSFRSYYARTGSIDMNGVYGSLNYNLKRWLGAEGEITGVGKHEGYSSTLGEQLGTVRVFSFLVGPTLYPLGHRKITPWGHALYGGAFYLNTGPVNAGLNFQTATSLVKSWEVGGGLDYNLTPHWGIRLIEADFASANFFPNTSTYSNQGSHRISVGFVYRFGVR